MSRPRARLLLSVLALVLPGAAAAQPPADPVAEAPIRIGAFGVAPRIIVSNIGVDTNVFNEVADPKRDFTAELSPAADVWLRAGRGLISMTGSVDLTWFQEYDTERSAGVLGRIRYDHRFNRLVPFASYEAANRRQRPGYEIDVRARSIAGTARAGVALRVGPKTDVELAVRRYDLRYDGDAVFDGRPLNQALNRTLDAVDATWTQRLTVLTAWIVRASAERERFEFSPERDADSIRVATGFELGRLALIRGRAFVGYRRLVGSGASTIPEFSGLTADVGVAYSAPTRTRLQIDVRRDLDYSYERLTPYFVQTGFRGTLTQVVAGKWDVQVHGGQDRLAYRTILLDADGRTDRVDRLGGGMGYQLNPELRVGFNVESFYRKSEVRDRTYRGVRAGAIVSYGF